MADLVVGDENLYLKAGEAILAIRSRSTGPEDDPQHPRAFAAAVESALSGPGFPTEDYLRRLIEIQGKRRFTNGEVPEFHVGELGGSLVLENAGQAALPVARHLLLLLEDRCGHEHVGFQALGALGPAARSLLPEILSKLGGFHSYQAACAVANIVGTSREAQDRVIALLSPDHHPFVRRWAISILSILGPGVSRITPTLIELARDSTGDAVIQSWAAGALGRVAQEAPDTIREAALDLLLELARQPEPGMRTSAYGSLGVLGRRAAQAVPLLIEGIGNSDACDGEPHDSAVRALGRFGAAASEAVPRLIDYLSRADPVDDEVIDVLGLIGPASAAALPLLRKLRRRKTADKERIDLARTRIQAPPPA